MSRASRRPGDRRRGGGPRREASGGAYMVPGERAVRELLDAAPERIRRLLVDRRRDFADLLARATQSGVSVTPLDAEELEARAPGIDVRGVLAIADPPPPVPLDALLDLALGGEPPRLVVALDGVVDPQNLGAIVRTCEFFGVHGVVWAKDRSAPLTPAVVRASAGATERLPLCVVTNLAAALMACKDAGFWILGTVADEGSSLAELQRADRVPEPLVVVMGSEHQGLRRLTRERCDLLATIDRRGNLGSLNVAAATAAVLALLHA